MPTSLATYRASRPFERRACQLMLPCAQKPWKIPMKAAGMQAIGGGNFGNKYCTSGVLDKPSRCKFDSPAHTG